MIYDVRNDCWSRVASLQDRRTEHGLVFSDEGLYAIGGSRNNDVLLDTVELFREGSTRWEQVTSMETARRNHATASVDQLVFVSGGTSNDGVALETVECYDTEEDIWRRVESMGQTRTEHSMAALKESLYAIGGVNTLRSGERYDLRRGMWIAEDRLRLTEGRRGFGLTALDGCLYEVGPTKTAERFDPKQGEWAPIPDMKRSKSSAASATIGGRLAVIGCSQDGISMEFFDPIANGWEVARPPVVALADIGFKVAWAPWNPDSFMINANT